MRTRGCCASTLVPTPDRSGLFHGAGRWAGAGAPALTALSQVREMVEILTKEFVLMGGAVDPVSECIASPLLMGLRDLLVLCPHTAVPGRAQPQSHLPGLFWGRTWSCWDGSRFCPQAFRQYLFSTCSFSSSRLSVRILGLCFSALTLTACFSG